MPNFDFLEKCLVIVSTRHTQHTASLDWLENFLYFIHGVFHFS